MKSLLVTNSPHWLPDIPEDLRKEPAVYNLESLEIGIELYTVPPLNALEMRRSIDGDPLTAGMIREAAVEADHDPLVTRGLYRLYLDSDIAALNKLADIVEKLFET